jgi:hypothetical protein
MASSIPPCPHDLRPGTAVCLRCQHAERGVKRAKQRQVIARAGAVLLSLAVITAVGVAAATALRGRTWKSQPPALAAATTDSTAASQDPIDSAIAAQPPEGTSAGVAASTVMASAVAAPTPGAPLPAPSAPSAPMVTAKQVALLVPVGRSELRDTMIAERAGDTVRVSFDLLLSRTRRADKFEAIVRSTLPQVYGASVDSALRALPVGAVARAGDLVTTLPERGFHIPIAGGRTIGVWPVTRLGRDGPLVVAYRAVATR